jgi:signal transduction histidine kinase
VAACHTINLTYHGEYVGALTLAPRPGERELAANDRQLLADFARQAGVVVHAARLAADLRRSRESIIAAREEERRRIRRDLHDGLGPVLATLVVQLDVARALFQSDQQAADAVLAEAASQTRAAIVDVRRLVYALRPPALDDLGLVGALRVHANSILGSELQVWVDSPEQLPPLPAAIEVAAYRIVQEALTNVLKHAGARTCRVALSVAGVERHRALLIEVSDDGVGLPELRHAGVGLVAMRERAEEVGGTCAIARGAAGGTRVSVCLPL